MWKTSSLKRQRQVELCSASFHRDKAVASLFSTEWHRMNPTARTHNGKKRFNEQAPGVEAGLTRFVEKQPRGEKKTKTIKTYRRSTSPWYPEKGIRRASSDRR